LNDNQTLWVVKEKRFLICKAFPYASLFLELFPVGTDVFLQKAERSAVSRKAADETFDSQGGGPPIKR
jgi:hypothetical protein